MWKCHLLLFYPTTMKHFSTGLWHAMNSGFYDNQWWPAQWLDWEEVPKHFPKPNLHQKKIMVTVRWSTARLIHYSFLNPGGTTALRGTLSKLMRCTKAAMPAPGAGQQKGPMLLHDNARPRHTTHVSKVEWTGLSSFALSPTFTWPLANWLPLLQVSQQLSIGKTLPQPARRQKCFPRVCWILKHGFLSYRNKLISHWQKCDCNGSYFD